MTTLYVFLVTFFSLLITNIAYTLVSKKLVKQNKVWAKETKIKWEWITYAFWAIIGISFLIYFISLRFFDQWKALNEYMNSTDFGKTNLYSHSILLSKGFLLDMCPFMSLALNVSFLDKSKKLRTYLAPFCILGGAITLPFVEYTEPYETFNLHYIFVGSQTNPLYFMMHWYLVVFGVLALRHNKKPKWSDFAWLHIVAIVYFGYIITISRTYGVAYNVTGTVENDWMDPDFGSWYGFTAIFKLPFPTIMILGYCLGYVFVNGLFLSRILTLNHLQNRKYKIKLKKKTTLLTK